MEEHYLTNNTDSLNHTLNLDINSSSIVAKQKLYNTQSIIAFLSFLMMFFFTGNIMNAQVTITKPNLSIPVCSGFPSSYYSLDDIIITETSTSNFSSGTNITLILTAPANFEFKANTGSVSAIGGGDFSSISSLTVSSSVITLTYSVDSPTNKADRLTFSQLQIRAINVASTGNITRTGGTGTISGLISGTTVTNTLTSVTGTSPSTANGGSNQTLAACATTTTLAGNTPTYGTGSWSVVSGTATITTPSSSTSGVTGLVLGTTATLRWTISNGSCPVSSSDVTITTSTGPACLVYCTPIHTTSCASNKITNVTFNTINNNSTCSDINGTSYTNYNLSGTPTTSLFIGSTYNLSITTGTNAIVSAWIDFNQNGSFEASEWKQVYTSGTNGTISISIPGTALAGNTTLRIRSRVNTSANGSTDACTSFASGETEDYTITLVTPAACVTPTAQPTALSLTPSGTSIAGSFVVASPPSDNYLVVMNITGTPPTIVNGTTYSIGGTVGAGNIVVNTENENTFTATGLTPNTKYYFFVYSFNSTCTGGPLYYTTSPLTGNTTTTSFSFCPPTSNVSTRYINSVQTVGNLTNMSNLNTNRSTNGYGDYTTLPTTTQIPGGGINLDVTLAISRQYLKAWVDWNNDGTLTDSGTELVYSSSGVLSIATSFGFVVPLGTTPGNYRLRIRSYEASQTFTPCGNLATGETEDYTITVVPDCPAIISTVTDNSRCESGTINLVATASGSPTQFRWYNALTGGSLVGTSPTGSWTTPSISSTTNYYVTAYNGTCESLIRTKIIAKVNSSSIINVTPSTPEVCGEGNIVTVMASGDNMVDDLINENFQSGLGSLSSVIIGGAGDASTQWQSKTSTFVPSLSVWKPAISSRSISDKFAFCTSDKNLLVNTSLESANFSTVPYSDLTLTFRQYYSYYGVPTDYAYVEVSTNNGASWSAVRTYVEDHAIATDFENVTIDLTPYINNANFKIRFRYNAQFCDGWAIDDVRLFGTKLMNTTFSWSGGTVDAYIDLACLTPYTNQSVTTVYIKPTPTQLSSTSWSFTASATLSNGCPVSKLVTIYNKTKQWLGTTSNWNDANNWKPVGVPDLTNCVFIPNTSVIPGSNYNAYAKNLTVKSTGNLELTSTSNLTVTDFVNVNTNGIFNIRDKASLIQTNNVANSGIVNIERVTPPISKLDYTYWSSPVSGFTLGQLSPLSSYMFSWIPTILSGTDWGPGNWNNESAATTMDPRKGYIVRAPNTFSSSTKTPYTATFIGTPNNGTITAPISKGTLTGTVALDNAEDDEWNLIGNPYPSGIDAAAFLNFADNIPIIDGTVYIWTHNSQPSTIPPDPFYGDYVLNYTDNDYAVFNSTGGTAIASTGGTSSGFIASGQSFFVKAANTMANGTTAVVTFKNTVRIAGKNSDFFKLTKNNKDEAIPKSVTDIERHRIWINLTNNSGAFSETLVGYVAGATQELDRSFDAESLGGNDVSFYSIIPGAELTIQGRALPFDENDQVILGYNSEITGELSIRIDHIDGLFNTQNIYLEDKERSVIHNLKEKPYVFNTEKGDFNDRFVLRYSNKTLGTNTFNLKSDMTNVIVNQDVTVQSSSQLIKNIVVYDLLGRKIDSYKKVNALKYTLSHLNKTTAGLIVKITLDDDTLVSKKIIY
ncbi:GEVED domain-containing protein [Flavobacterium sp. ZS1P70]|uniref:GEVED domain-containing protein n=1 Tax=Flavobacterium zhoui TaxID=3230414 RepID=A0ABW6I2D3_9FLAO